MGAPPEPARPRLKVTVNVADPVACQAAAREDRDYWNDLYDHEDTEE